MSSSRNDAIETLGPEGPPEIPPRPEPPGNPSVVPIFAVDMAYNPFFPALDPAQLQALSGAIGDALLPVLGAKVDARAAFVTTSPIRSLHIAVWSDTVAPGSPQDNDRQVAVESLSFRDSPFESYQFGVSVNAGILATLARRWFASLPKFYAFSSPSPVKYDEREIELRSLDLTITSTPDADPAATKGNEVLSFATIIELIQSKIPPASPLKITLTDSVRADALAAWEDRVAPLRTTTRISDISASFWDNPLVWFGALLLDMIVESGALAGVTGSLGGVGAQLARLLPTQIPIPGTKKKLAIAYDNSRLEAGALVLRGGYELVDRVPSIAITGPVVVTQVLKAADRDPSLTTVLRASYGVAPAEFSPTHFNWAVLGGPKHISGGPDAPVFTPDFIVPRTWGTETFFIGVSASDDAGNLATGYLFVDAGLISPPPPPMPHPPIPPYEPEGPQ